MAKHQKCNGLYLQLAIFVLMCVYVHTCENDEECESIDRKNLGNGVSLDDIGDLEKNEKAVFKGEQPDTLDKLVLELKENALLQIKIAGTEALQNLRKETNDDAEADMKTESVRSSLTGGKDGENYYYETCPFVRTWLKPGCYYFRFELEHKQKYKYCFNFWYIHFICCQTKQCMTATCPFPRFDRNSECEEEKRSVNAPFVCYNYEKKNGKYEGSWLGVEFRRITLARDCCCRKQSSYRNDETCTDEDSSSNPASPPAPQHPA